MKKLIISALASAMMLTATPVVAEPTYISIEEIGNALGLDLRYDEESKSLIVNENLDTNNRYNSGSVNNKINKYKDNSNNEKSIISKEQAEDIAIKEVGGGSIVYSSLDYNRGHHSSYDEYAEYDVRVQYDGEYYDLDIDAVSGKVTSYYQNNGGHGGGYCH